MYRYGVVNYFQSLIQISSCVNILNFIKPTDFNLLTFYSLRNFHSNKLTMNAIKFIDIGANLQDPMFSGIYKGKKRHEADMNRVLDRARKNGVDKIIITSGTLKDLKQALEICNTYDKEGGFLYTTVGVHPCTCNDFLKYEGASSEEESASKYLEDLISLAKSNKDRIAAVGEMGLDFDRLNYCSRETQIKYFEFQMKLLDEFKLPIFLHMRNATAETIDILLRYKDKWKDTVGVCHSFTATTSCLNKVLDMGFYVGINGCSLKTEENLENVKKIPLDKLILETDAPWCSIKPSYASYDIVRSRVETVKNSELVDDFPNYTFYLRNEPCNISQVAEVVHSLSYPSINFEEFCLKIRENTLKLFTLLE